MAIRCGNTTNNLISEYVGTRYDTIQEISANLSSLISAGDNIQVILDNLEAILAAADSVTLVDNLVTELNAVYLGSSATPPTTNLDGGPLVIGSMYFDTVLDELRVWSGTIWRNTLTNTANEILPDQTGQANKFLQTDGTDSSWQHANITPMPVYEMSNTISASYTITAGNNAVSSAPMTIASNADVTVSGTSRWVIV